MIKILEKDFLDDDFINKSFAENIHLNDKIYFSKDNIYYFGNYKQDKLPLIKEKLLRNKKSLISAIENKIKFIICANSIELFNNTFKKEDLNIYTMYSPFMFKKRFKKLVIKRNRNNIDLINVKNLEKVISANNFRYKNLICISDEKLINEIIKKTKQTTLSY